MTEKHLKFVEYYSNNIFADDMDESEIEESQSEYTSDILDFEKSRDVFFPKFLQTLLQKCGSIEIGSFSTYSTYELDEMYEGFFEVVDEEPENYPSDMKSYFPLADSLDGDEFLLKIEECQNMDDAPIYQWDHEECEMVKKYDSFLELIIDMLEEWKEEDEDDEEILALRDDIDAILN